MIRRVMCVLLLLVMLGLVPIANAQQEGSLQGKIILFGISNGEADPFDRGDPGASRLGGLLGRGGANVQEVNWAVSIPANTDLVVLIGPIDAYSGAQIARLWSYLEQGGSLLLLADPPGENGDALPHNSGLFELFWSDFGLRMMDMALVNPASEAPPPAPFETTDLEGTPLPTPTPIVGDTPVEVISNLPSNNPQHPILFDVNVEGLTVNLARPMEQEAFVEGASVVTLLYTSNRVYAESNVAALTNFGTYLFNNDSDLPQSAYLVAAASEDIGSGTRIVMVGDGDVGRNGFGFATSPPGSEAFVFPDDVRFILNAVHWLVGADPSSMVFTSEAPVATATPTITPTPTLIPTATPAQ